jgi:hypothetical protein
MQTQKFKRYVFGGLVTVFSLSGIWLHAQTSADSYPDGPGKQAFIKICTQCHEADKVAGLRYSRDEWQSLVDEMRVMGGDGTEDEWKAVVEYLATNFPRK